MNSLELNSPYWTEYLKRRSKLNLDTGCWEWQGSKDKKGYGHFNTYKGLETGLAHRSSYKVFIGDLKKNLQVCHTCDNPSCINPEHLFLGTNSDNQIDSIKKGRQNTVKLTPKCISEIRDTLGYGFPQSDIARYYKVSQATISMINSNKIWKFIPQDL